MGFSDQQKSWPVPLTLKEPGGRIHPLCLFCYISASCYFFRTETSWLFSFKPCARFKNIFKNRVMMRCCVIACWVQRKTDFPLKLHKNRVFLSFLSFRIHFYYVLSYLFDLFGVRTCVSILWHTSLLKNATFAWKNSEKPWFWRFLVIFVFLTWRNLWRHTRYVLNLFGTNGLGRVIAIH